MNKIKLQTNHKYRIFFLSDTHWGHENCLKFDNRPFSNIWEHDLELIRRWNSVVGKNDYMFFLGDFAYRCPLEGAKMIFSQLNGKKYLIRGNHDPKLGEKLDWIEKFDHLLLQVDEQTIHLCHYPIESWNGGRKGGWHLFGHSHTELLNKIPNRLCVCANQHNYIPLDFQYIKDLLCKPSSV